MNYYELFNVKMAPLVDKTYVTKKYFELQKIYHPDFYSQGTETEQEDVLQKSADINKAYKIFQHPGKALAYFLEVKGFLESDEKYDLPPAFLMEMMELNEELDESDAAASRDKIEEYILSLDKETDPILSTGIERELSEKEIQALKAYHYKKKYLNRILDRLND